MLHTDVIRNEVLDIMLEIGAKPSEMDLAEGTLEWLETVNQDPTGGITELFPGYQMEPKVRQTIQDHLEGAVADRRAKGCRR